MDRRMLSVSLSPRTGSGTSCGPSTGRTPVDCRSSGRGGAPLPGPCWPPKCMCSFRALGFSFTYASWVMHRNMSGLRPPKDQME